MSCLRDVLVALRGRFGEPDEVTVEANPEQITPALLAGLREAGVTRLSLGVQSFASDMLTHLGRGHQPEQARLAIEDALEAGFERVNVDIIFGGPRQELAGHLADIRAVVDLGAEHVSVYGLTIEPHTRLGHFANRGETVVAADGAMTDMFERGGELLAELGLRRYEVSNFARPGHWSRHNVLTWMGGEYLGIGLGAHSMRRLCDGSALRRATGRDLKAYRADPAGHEGFL